MSFYVHNFNIIILPHLKCVKSKIRHGKLGGGKEYLPAVTSDNYPYVDQDIYPYPSTPPLIYIWIRICGYVDKDTSLSTSVQPLIIRS